MRNNDFQRDPDRIPVDFVVGRTNIGTTGIGRYIVELMCNMERVDARVIDFNPSLGIRPGEKLLSLLFFPHKVKTSVRKDSVKHFASQIQSQVLNFHDLRPSLVTCHDFHPLISGEYSWLDTATVYMGVKGMLKADRVCCVSDFTAEEAQRYLHLDPKRITVIPPGIDHQRYHPCRGKEEPRRKLGLPLKKKLFLFVGSEQPRKNLPLILSALKILEKEGVDFLFLKIGKPQWKKGRASTVKAAASQGVLERIHFLDEVPENKLPDYYRAADVLVFPSRYEGFGLPLLEAMACGCPVVALRRASVPEVVGEAGILLDEENPQRFAEALARVVSDDGLAADLSERGIRRAALFSWERTARLYRQLYEELLEGG